MHSLMNYETQNQRKLFCSEVHSDCPDFFCNDSQFRKSNHLSGLSRREKTKKEELLVIIRSRTINWNDEEFFLFHRCKASYWETVTVVFWRSNPTTFVFNCFQFWLTYVTSDSRWVTFYGPVHGSRNSGVTPFSKTGLQSQTRSPILKR